MTPPTDRRAHLLLIEGVTGVGKSTVLDHLLRRHVTGAPQRKLRTVLHLTQAHTYGPLAPAEDAGTLTREASLAHLERIVAMLEWLAATVADEAVPKCFALVDALHLTHCVRPGVLEWNDVAPFDARLAAAGCRLLLLDASDATIRRRSVADRAETEFIRGYALRRFAPDLAGLERWFIGERDRFREMFARSAMEKRTLAAELPEEHLAVAAYEFWLGDAAR
ncbi:MAG TPA: hypothetical protein VF092_09770 [Longimicrobium sp.]